MSNNYAQHQLKLIRHTGVLIFFQQRTYVVSGTLEQCEAEYKSAQTYNLLVGWWSLMSLLAINWIALISNFNAMRRVRKTAQESPAHYAASAVAAQNAPPRTSMPPGWYADPSGPGQRYWDGAKWTHWTHPPSHR